MKTVLQPNEPNNPLYQKKDAKTPNASFFPLKKQAVLSYAKSFLKINKKIIFDTIV